MQKIFIAGRLTKDAELRATPSGAMVSELNIAVDDWNGKEKTTLWVRGSIWGARAEKINEYLTKGTSVSIIGKLNHTDGNPRVWTNKDGKAMAGFEVLVNEIDFSGGSPKVDFEDEELPF